MRYGKNGVEIAKKQVNYKKGLKMTQKEIINEFYKWLKETTLSRRKEWFECDDKEIKYYLQSQYSAFDDVLTKFTEMGLTPYANITLELGLKYKCIETSYYSDAKEEMFTKDRIYVVTEQMGFWRGLPSNDGNVRTPSCGVLTEEYFKKID